jgi:hypothetical protein
MHATVFGVPSDASGEEANADDTLPMWWDYLSVESLLEKQKVGMDVYIWWAENFWPQVVGQDKWKLDITSRNKKLSE